MHSFFGKLLSNCTIIFICDDEKLELLFLFFPIQKNHHHFLFYLSPYCNPSPYGLGFANRWAQWGKQEGKIFLKREKIKNKFQLVKPGAQLSILAFCGLLPQKFHLGQKKSGTPKIFAHHFFKRKLCQLNPYTKKELITRLAHLYNFYITYYHIKTNNQSSFTKANGRSDIYFK